MSSENFNVIIIGAGLSGIGAGYRLQTRCPAKTYAILEARSEIGGTWDLFRYPGVRSDSDMFTLGYPFRHWKEARAIADGSSILNYVRDTAREYGIDRHIRFQQRVESASWSSDEGRWLIQVKSSGSGETMQYSCDFLYGCTGYYRYDAGYQPAFPGADNFRGQFVHPQHWPADLDYAGKKVVVIGSGATAVTLVPAMAETASHVTMLQRSPTYMLTLPMHDGVAELLHKCLPTSLGHRAVRWKNILISIALYQLSRRSPDSMRRLLRKAAIASLPPGYDVDKHFNPRYQPWDQRLCLIPDADLYRAISKGSASVVTDEIETLTANGILLKSGEQLEADIIVSATGLRMLALGGIQLTVDREKVDIGNSFVYKGTMVDHVPNFAFCVGYTNNSWTLRADLASTFICRVLNHMDCNGYRTCMPVCDRASLDAKPLLNLSSGYVQRASADLPKQGGKAPWIIRQNYILDMITMKFSRMEDGVLKFERAVEQPQDQVVEKLEPVA